jgi:hypothetical protein
VSSEHVDRRRSVDRALEAGRGPRRANVPSYRGAAVSLQFGGAAFVRHDGPPTAARAAGACSSLSTRCQSMGDGVRFLDSHWYTTAFPAAPILRANPSCVSRSR